MTLSPASLALVSLVAAAAAWDLSTRRIPNALTLPGLLLGLGLRALDGGGALAAGLAGAAVAFAIALPLVLAGGLGGGDAKLLALVGAFVGLGGLPSALLVTGLAGGVLAAATVVRRGALSETLGHCRRLLARIARGPAAAPARTLATPGAIAVPYGVAIALGALAGVVA